jgi:acetyltransferase-like isoleucine patch superfamily enzyme
MQSIYRALRKPQAAFNARLNSGRARRAFFRKCKERNSHIERAIIYLKNYDKLHIGSNVKVNDAYFDTSGEIKIGDATFFGWGVKVITGTHPIYEKGVARQRMSSFRPVTIGAGVWVASYAIILPETVIGDDSVVSAGSVVKGVFPSGQLISGNPAKVVKSINFSQT